VVNLQQRNIQYVLDSKLCGTRNILDMVVKRKNSSVAKTNHEVQMQNCKTARKVYTVSMQIYKILLAMFLILK